MGMMGKAGVSVAVLAVMVTAGTAPAAGQAAFAWGPRIGTGLHTMLFEDPATDSQTELTIGFHAGIAVTRELRGPFAAEIDVLLSREGFRGPGAHTGDLKRDFLEVPILFRIRTPTRVSLHLAAGTSVGLALRCVQANVALAGSTSCDDPVMGAEWRRLDVAGVVGAGVGLPFGSRTLMTDLFFSLGFRDLNGDAFIPGTARSLSIGFTFALLTPGRPGLGGAS